MMICHKSDEIRRQEYRAASTFQRSCFNCTDRKRLLKNHSTATGKIDAIPPAVHDVLREPGQALDIDTKSFLKSRLHHNISKMPIRSSKVSANSGWDISEPGDKFEQEADRIARDMMQNPHRHEANAVNDQKDKGFEFSKIRIHTGSKAAESARALNAEAYTVGSDVVFGHGKYSPGTYDGRELIAHELVHVIQQDGANKSGAPRIARRSVIYGSGFSRPFNNDASEVTAAISGNWYPSSVDLAATAHGSGGGTGVATISGLLNFIASKNPNSIEALDLIGHSNANGFALAGTITADDVLWNPNGLIDQVSLRDSQTRKRIEELRNRFRQNARITLYGCHSGGSGYLLSEVSNAFGVCSAGFQNEITWCLGWSEPSKTINSRGKIAINPASNDCSTYKSTIYDLAPDSTFCAAGP
ncbi:Uncharacterised protein [uncultured archaeon]|nr:Uncharacterised protein [uncultured archaeon]